MEVIALVTIDAIVSDTPCKFGCDQLLHAGQQALLIKGLVGSVELAHKFDECPKTSIYAHSLTKSSETE